MSARERRAKAKRRRRVATRRAVVPVALSGALATSTALALAAPEVAGAAVTSVAQVQNINHVGASSNPGSLTQIGGTTFFTAYEPSVGRELFKSDGTTAGTVVLKDISPGPAGSYPRNLTTVGSTLYFTANDGSTGTELWKSDGTAAGTVEVKDIAPGRASGYPIDLTNVGGTLYFAAADGLTGTELWKSDGTAAGTIQVSDINSGAAGSYPRDITNVNGTVFFAANDGTTGNELWKSDGTSDGTVQVKDINPGSVGSLGTYYRTDAFANVGSTLYFIANDGTTGRELWKSDGTSDGTVQVKDINPGSGSGFGTYYRANAFANVGSTLYFVANDGTTGRELWKSDGSPDGTVEVKDINPGSGNGLTANYGYGSGFATLGGTLYFAANDGSTGTELWKSDGTSDGTVEVKDINSGYTGSYPRGLTNVGGILYFAATDSLSTGRELWKSDGSSAGTVLVKDINPGVASGVGYYSYSYNYGGSRFANAGGTVLFAANDGTHGTELWKSDGTSGGTVLVKDVDTGDNGSYPRNFANVGSTLYFTANDGTHGTELWKSDGTSGGAVLVKDIATGSANGVRPYYFNANLTNVGGTLYFAADDGTHGTELWKSDGTSAGTVEVADIEEGASGSYPRSLTNVGGTLFFAASNNSTGRELWKSDGTSAGTVLVKDINPGSSGSMGNGYYFAGAFANVGGTLYFVANDGVTGNELWKSDGTSTGTVLVKDINPGAGSGVLPIYGYRGGFANVGGILYFDANDGSSGTELWKSDGTPAGTVEVKDIQNGAGASYPRNLTNVGGTLYFAANDGVTGTELWKSDGTSAGTVLVKDINPGLSDGIVGGYRYGYSYRTSAQFANVNGVLFFAAGDGVNGSELWRSDGTSAGTVLVKDINPGSLGSYPRNLTNVGNTLVFAANDGSHGTELWQSDGTAAGTLLVQDIRPGIAGSMGYNYTRYYRANGRGALFYAAPDGSSLFFTANDGATGNELWKATASGSGVIGGGGGGGGGTGGGGGGGTGGGGGGTGGGGGGGGGVTQQTPPPSSPTSPAVVAQAPSITNSTAADFSGTVNPEGLVTTVHFEYGLDPAYRGPGSSSNVFDQSTADQTVTGSSQVVSASVHNLIPNALYHVRMVATSAAGTTISQEQTFKTPQAPPPPPPVVGKTQDIAPVGKVFVLLNGKLVLLTQARQIPSGTLVDAAHGSIELTSALGTKGKTVSGTFGGAVFKITQSRSGKTKGLTTLTLVEGGVAGAPTYASCTSKSHRSTGAHAAGLSKRVLQILHAHDHGGHFRTVGRYSAATVRGTKWDTADRCDGTLTSVHQGIVTVTDNVRHKTITLHAGQSYLAKPKKH